MRARCTGPLVSECIYTSCCNKVASSCSSFPSLSLSYFSVFSFFTPFPLFPYRGCIYKRAALVFPSSVKTETCHALSLALTRSVRCWKRGRYAKTFHIRIFKYSTMHRFWRKYEEPTRLSLPFSLSLFLFLSFRAATFICTWSISAAFPRYSNIGMIFADKLHFIRRPVIN